MAGRVGLLACVALLVPVSGALAEPFRDAAVAATWDDNVGRAEHGSDARSDASLQLDARAGRVFATGSSGTLTVAALARVQGFRQLQDLGEAGLGASVSLRHKTGLGSQAPWVAAFLDAERIESGSGIRDGWRAGAGLRAGRRVGEAWNLSATVRAERREADEDEQQLPAGRPVFPGVTPTRDGDVFDLRGLELQLRAERQLGEAWLLSGSLALREGDVVSTGRASADIVAAADAITADEAFGAGRSAYRLEGRTVTAALGLNYPLGDTASMDLGWEHQHTEADRGIAYGRNLLRLQLLWAW